MKLIRKARRARRTVRRAGIAAILAAALGLSGCGAFPTDGHINETETGRNGVKAEVKDGDGDYEVYLVRDTDCREGDYIDECADQDDYLVEPDGHTSGVNPDSDDD